MDNKEVTIIVPCYNVAKYVKKSIESLLNQTLKNIKIITIDDCSTDNTYEILKEIEKDNKDILTVVKNEENMGLAATRNKGIKLAETKYIGFIDSDDYVNPNYYEDLLAKIKENDAGVAIANMVLVDENDNQIGEIQKGINEADEDIKIGAIDNGLAASACNKLIKKELMLKFLFLEGKINEDVAAILPLVLHADKIAYSDTSLYYYVQRNTSIQNSSFSEKRFDMFEAVQVALDRIKDLDDYETYKSIILYHQVLMLYIYVICGLPKFRDRQKYIKIFIKKNKSFRIENNACTPMFARNQSKYSGKFYFLITKLLKLKSATIINLFLVLGKILNKVRLKISYIKNKLRNPIKKNLSIDDLVDAAKRQSKLKDNDIKVSVVVPNYNYEKFLLERIYSIINQTEKIHELIILDDCSTDNSRELLDEIYEKIKPYINVKKEYNKENTKIAFKQWKKGFNIADGDYVWIAEADDYCDKRLLNVLLNKVRKDKDIRIAYVDTAFMDANGNVFLKSIKSEIDLRKTGHWDKDYINNGKNELENYTFLNCTIANVSSCIIKKDNYDDIFEKAIKYRQAGDWVVYSNVMIKGDIAYINKQYNFYRVHGNNITSTMKKQNHLEEIKSIHKEIGELIKLEDWHYQEFEKRYEFLKKVWRI